MVGRAQWSFVTADEHARPRIEMVGSIPHETGKTTFVQAQEIWHADRFDSLRGTSDVEGGDQLSPRSSLISAQT